MTAALRNAEVALQTAAGRFIEAEDCYSPSQSSITHPLGYPMDERREAYVEAFAELKVAARALVAAEQADAEDDDVTDDRAALPWSPYERLPWEGAAQ